MARMISQRDIERWKRLALDKLSELGVEIGGRKDDLSARRVAIVVGETFGQVFDGRVEINRLTCIVSTLECQMYLVAKEARLTCGPLQREEPPSSWKGGAAAWQSWQLKLPDFWAMPAPFERELAEAILENLLKGGEGEYATGGSNHGKTVVRRVGMQTTAHHTIKKPGTRLHQSGRGGKAV